MYVDDLLIIGEKAENIEKVKGILKSNFTMKDLAVPQIFLGITVKYYNKHHIKLTMEDTINRIQENFKITESKRIYRAPIDKSFNRFDENSPILDKKGNNEYRKVIGTLLYIANTVRLDISYGVNVLSRYVEEPRMTHLKAAYRIINYLIQTKRKGLNFTNENKLKLPTKDYRLLDTNKKAIIDDYPTRGKYMISTIVDASYANEEESKSQYGYVTYLNNNIISWKSKKQPIVTLSSAEAEYVGLTEGLKSTLHFNHLMKELKFNVTYATLCSDNQAALQLASHKVQHQRTKHINIRYHFIREKVLNKEIRLNYINTNYNVADGLTKFLNNETNIKLDKLIF